MGPQTAAQIYAQRHPEAKRFEVTLYGSLAATGKGHMTDVAICEGLQCVAPVEIVWNAREVLPFHPNGMKFVTIDADGNRHDEWTVYSVGGGALSEGENDTLHHGGEDVYSMQTLSEIQEWCERYGRGYWEYVEKCEDSSIWDYLREIWNTMQAAVERGLDNEGVLPGPL